MTARQYELFFLVAGCQSDQACRQCEYLEIFHTLYSLIVITCTKVSGNTGTRTAVRQLAGVAALVEGVLHSGLAAADDTADAAGL